MKNKTIAIIILAIILSGFVFALIANSVSNATCTKRDCLCLPTSENPEKLFKTIAIPCNDCSKAVYFYATFIFNVGKTYSAKQIIICDENQVQIDERINSYNNCKYYLSLFGYKIGD